MAGQRLRTAGHWNAAKDSFAVCGNSACPAIIRNDCAKWTEELLTSMPTVVLGAQDAEGHDLTDAQVSIDGNWVTGKERGQAIPIDPGPHVVLYQRDDGAMVRQEFVVREGDKGRSLVLRFPAIPSRVAMPLGAPPTDAPAATSESADKNTIAGLVVGAAGVAFVGAGIYFVAKQGSETASLDSQCAGGVCRPGTVAAASVPSEVSTVNTNRALAGATFGVGAAALGVGAYFVFRRPLAPPAGAVAVVPLPGGASLGYRLAF